MIVVEHYLRDLFAQLPTIQGFQPKFNWGSQDSLNMYLAQNHKYYECTKVEM